MFEWLSKIRRYSNFFEAPSKELKELNVAKKWLDAYGCEHGYAVDTLVVVDDEWPDCELMTSIGAPCGIEVTELVDRDCIVRNQREENVYRTWSDSDIVEAISDRLLDKSKKSHGGKYNKLIVLIHTDEFEISYDRYNNYLGEHLFALSENIDEAYLVYSYDPKHQKCPVSALKFEKFNENES